MTDYEIIKKVLDGDRNKYGILVERYQSMIFRTCLGYVHNKEDANDLTQEVFIRAYQSLKSFRGEAAFSTWIYRIAVNTSLNKVRKSPKLSLWTFESLFASFSNNSVSHPDPNNDNPEHSLIQAEDRELVLKALDSLPENQRTAIVLSKYDDLPQKKIAEIMHTTEGAVEALLQRAKTNLRKKLLQHRKK
jgi:RNA polymerase sigma-70 factor (ECF subfamily)